MEANENSIQSVQQRLEVVRSSVILAEQDYVRVRTLIKEQEAVVRSLLEKQGQINEESTVLLSRVAALTEEVECKEKEKQAASAKVQELLHTFAKTTEELRSAKSELAAVVSEKESVIKSVEETKRALAQSVKDTEEANKKKSEEASAIRDELRAKKERLLLALSEL